MNSIVSEERWVDVYRRLGAFWVSDGNARRPHALLTSGMHSDGFFNSRLVVQDDVLLKAAARDLVTMIVAGLMCNLDPIDRVVGPQTGATRLAEFIASEISSLRGAECGWASPAKQGEGKDKRLVFDDPSRSVAAGETILLCEDVLTTGGNVEAAAHAVMEKGGIIQPLVLALVNRSGLERAGEKKIVALVSRPMNNWDVPAGKPCPLCDKGSRAVRPKECWAELTAEY